MSTDRTDPSLDVLAIARNLQAAYAERCGVASKYAHTKALISPNVNVAKFATALVAGGFEMYSDCVGNLCIRTKDEGDAHRALVQAERDLDYLERNPHMVRYAKLPSIK